MAALHIYTTGARKLSMVNASLISILREMYVDLKKIYYGHRNNRQVLQVDSRVLTSDYLSVPCHVPMARLIGSSWKPKTKKKKKRKKERGRKSDTRIRRKI